jgi:hypothetical protein
MEWLQTPVPQKNKNKQKKNPKNKTTNGPQKYKNI